MAILRLASRNRAALGLMIVASLCLCAQDALAQTALSWDLAESEPLRIAERAIVSHDADLRLGTLIAGQPGRTLSITDPDAAVFRIAATPGRELKVRFESLPRALEAPGGRVPILEGGWVAGWSFTPEPLTAVMFDPQSGFTVRFSSPDQILYVWLGAQLAAVDSRQPSGEYAGTATLRVE